ncbi:MAG: hypothetical protein M3Q17_02540 [Actinomycetota bacterium]|nr:hypothetical protein [Actinomycetota bacterium]
MRQPPARHRWLRPVGVHIENGFLVYDRQATKSKGGEICASAGMLNNFLMLGRRDDQAIADYAGEYGVLGLCQHGVVHTACTHADDDVAWLNAGDDADAVPDERPMADNPTDHEPLDGWRFYIELANATLAAAQRLHGGKSPSPIEDGDRLAILVDYGTRGLEKARDEPNTVERGRSVVANVCTRWLVDGQAQLVMSWDTGASVPQLTIGAVTADAGMFAGLGLQVVLACARSDGVAICSGCGGLHAPTRQPRPGQRTYCADCRQAGVPQRHADRDRRDKRRAAAGPGRRDR